MFKVCIDAGHAGIITDPGAVAANGWSECELNLAVAVQLRDQLSERGFAVVMTRDSDDNPASDELAYRTEWANANQADIMVSLHGNAAANTQAQGVEVFCWPGSIAGKLLAGCIIQQLVGLGRLNRGIKAARFFVLKHTAMPAVLVELGFLSNGAELAWLQQASNQHQLAVALAKGIELYFNRSQPMVATGFFACR